MHHPISAQIPFHVDVAIKGNQRPTWQHSADRSNMATDVPDEMMNQLTAHNNLNGNAILPGSYSWPG